MEIGLKKKKNRDKLILASKVAGPGLPWVRDGGKNYTEQKIEKALKEGIRDIVAEESIIGQDGKKKVRIPVKGIKEYQFIYGDNSKKVGSAPGKDIHRGQKIAEDKEDKKSGNKPGDKPGEEFYDVEITLEELAEYLFSDLELPDLDKKKFKFLSSDTFRRKGFRPKP